MLGRHVHHQRPPSPTLSLWFHTSQLGDAKDGKLVFVSVCWLVIQHSVVCLRQKYKQIICLE